MSTVLFTWELGAGVGHMAPYREIAERLIRNGHRVVFALRDLSRSHSVFQDIGVACVQAPIKTAPIAKPILQPATYAQMLHNLGYESPGELTGLVRAWRSLFEYIQPDLTVFDHSPTAMLAARGVPTRKMVIGIGFLVPPDIYPLPSQRPWMNHDAEQLRHFEDSILHRINLVLEDLRAPTLRRLGQLFSDVEETVLTTFKELDHYAEREGGNYWGICSYYPGAKPEWPGGEGAKVFAYLKPSKNLVPILQALTVLKKPTLIVPDHIPEDTLKKFTSDTMVFSKNLFDLKTVGAECRLAVHNANHGTMAQLLLAGKPTLMVPLQLEQLLLARRAEQLGVGLVIQDQKAEDLATRLNAVLTGASYMASAEAFAKRYADFDPPKQGMRLYERMEAHLAEGRPAGAVNAPRANAQAPAQRPRAAMVPNAGLPRSPVQRATPQLNVMPAQGGRGQVVPGPGHARGGGGGGGAAAGPLLQEALQHHQAGRLAEAERLYAQALDRQPNHPDGLHLLGVLRLQQGDMGHATELIEKAIAINPNMAAYHANLAEGLRLQGRLGRAANSCQEALRLQPDFPDARNNFGLILHAQGHRDRAIEQYREAVRLRPKFGLAHNNLANALRESGDLEGALLHFKLAVEAQPEMAEARSNLGQILLEEGRAEEALEHCEKAVELKPNLAAAHSNLGNVYRELGRLDEAKACYAQAIQRDATLGMPFSNMGQALQEEGKLEEAMEWYRKGLRAEPNSARIYSNIASLLADREMDDDAIAHYQAALRLDPSYVDALTGLGGLFRDQQRNEEARKCLERALELKKKLPSALVSLATLEEETGDLEKAEQHLRKALEQEPNHAGAYGQLATLLRKKMPDEDLANMKALLEKRSDRRGKGMGLHYGLAQVLDARGEYAEAAEHLKIANELRKAQMVKKGLDYRPEEHQRFVDNLIAHFTPEFFARVKEFGSASERPVFVFGLPRSSTTLTEQIIASHSKVFGAGERRFARESFEAIPGLIDPSKNTFEVLDRLDAESVRLVAEQHLQKLDNLNADALRVVDKMPDNYLNIGLLAVLFPKARFIHCRRDLRDIAVSCWMTNFRHIRWACVQDEIAHRFGQYVRVMEHWRKVMPVPMLEIDYETTVEDPEGTARKLIDWVGLEFEDACLEPHKTDRPVRTASVTQVREPIYKRSVARWKNYEPALGELFAKLGQA
ncbi:MAG: tetratricopeptide repeat protein [Planctomycetes bacterium]|nr:tetratricopeptide repeat protein [Planctomycetota bacterium]